MRPINNSILNVPGDWDARSAAAAIAVADSTNRPATISDYSTVWTSVKEVLAAVSSDKCWYCETKRSRADYAVDHFRPKNAVAQIDCPDHSGYWWLAFRLSNLRYSCTFCNSRRRDLETGVIGGKHDRFPIAPDGQRARIPSDDLEAEHAMLLDPTVKADTDLLFFEIDGRVVPLRQDGSREALRADVSISLYHLNHSALKRARKRVYSEIRRVVEEGDIYFQPGAADPRVAVARESVLRRILDLKAEDHEYLAAVYGFFAMLTRGAQRPWLDGALT